MQRCVAIRLKIPDNEAYTALTTLQRLGIPVGKLERADVRRYDVNDDPAALAARVERDEAIFNPNKHTLTVLETCTPRVGEAWVEEIDTGKITGWRLFDAAGAPAASDAVHAATEQLLCNPAIEKVIAAP